MIDEDQPQRQPAKQIEPQFALAGDRKRNRRHRGGRRRRGLARDRIRCALERWSGNSIGNGRHLAPVLGQVRIYAHALQQR